MKRIFLPQIAQMTGYNRINMQEISSNKNKFQVFCIFICRFIRKTVPLHADLKEKA
jgi:hypothetical protein